MSGIGIRPLARHELPDLWTIDRAEVIEGMYRQQGSELVRRAERHDVRGWPPGERELYEPMLIDCFDRGGIFTGAFAGPTLVGAAVLDNRFIGRAGDRLQLKFLHVSRAHRRTGLGRTLFERAVARARECGARGLYISATPSENTVRFYLGLGCRPTTDPDPDLLALEPEDIHFEFDLDLEFDPDPDRVREIEQQPQPGRDRDRE